MRKLLMVALELPPCRSAGVQRTLRFSEFLKDFLWQPVILTATENVYERKDDTLVIAPDVARYVTRAKCYDVAKKYAFKGCYFQWMALPDKYWPWYFDAVKQGCKTIEQEKPDIIWSTYPVLTAHWIARKLRKKFGIPWVADFRDPLQCRYDDSAKSYSWLKKLMERSIIKEASKVVFTSERAASLYRNLYPNEDPNKFIQIENGYYISGDLDLTKPEKRRKFQLLYSGSLYTNGRNPKPLFMALSLLKISGIVSEENFILTFRPGKNCEFQTILVDLGISELVEFLPPISFEAAVAEMKQASATVLIQDEIFERQIPGKIYDYISIKRPILAITPQDSATADLISDLNFGIRAWGVKEIANGIKYMLNNKIICEVDIDKYSRKAKTKELAELLDSLYQG